MIEMTPSEREALGLAIANAGAIGRNALVCKCGHIDYRPNNELFTDCVFFVPSCIECREEVKS